MKKIALCMIAALFAAPVVADEPIALESLGLVGLESVEDSAGLEVRGKSSNSYSSGLSAIRAFAIDPATGATFNANASNYSKSSEEGAVGADSTASAATFAGFTGLSFDIADGTSTFSADLAGSTTSSGLGDTQDVSAAARAFAFTAGGFTFAL